jgi:hypothetical protein
LTQVDAFTLDALDLRLYAAPSPVRPAGDTPAGGAGGRPRTSNLNAARHEIARHVARRDPWYRVFLYAPLRDRTQPFAPLPSECEATLLHYAREAHYSCALPIFKCMCWLQTDDPSKTTCGAWSRAPHVFCLLYSFVCSNILVCLVEPLPPLARSRALTVPSLYLLFVRQQTS